MVFSGCSVLGQVGYRPPFLPITFLIDNLGHISIQGSASIVTEVGEFSLNVSDTVNPPDDGFLVIIRHLHDGEISDAVYQIHSGDDEVDVTVDGHIELQITNKRVTIDASQGQVQSVVVRNTDTSGSTSDGSGDQANPCRSIQEFASASAATGGSDFPELPFPAESLSYHISTTYYGSYSSRLIKVCSPSLTPDDAREFFASNLPNDGWEQSDTFPYKGDPTRSCGDPYCWVQGSSPSYYVSLEQVSGSGSSALYTLRLGTLP
jgi:hypothetical protein